MESVRPNIAAALFGGIPKADLNPLEAKVIAQAAGNPGAASALQKLSEVEGGIAALNRLLTEQPGISSGMIWELFKDRAHENPTVFRDAVVQYLDAHPATALEAPEVTLASGQKATVKKFDELYFTPGKAQELERLGIPYPKEYFLVMGVGRESDKGDGFVTVMGSVGGRFTFRADEPIVARVSAR